MGYGSLRNPMCTSFSHSALRGPSLTLGSIIDSEVGSSVDNDALDRDAEPLVETLQAIRLEDLGETVTQTTELTLGGTLAHVGSQPGPGKVQRVDKAEGGGPSCPTGSQVTSKVAPELLMPVHAPQEDLLVFVLEGEVESLGGEVTDHVGQVTPPEREKALLLGDSHHAINDPFVLLLSTDLFAGMLDLWENGVKGMGKELGVRGWAGQREKERGQEKKNSCISLISFFKKMYGEIK